MPISVKAGSFAKSTTPVTFGNTPADQNNAISGLSFQPKVIFLFSHGISGTSSWTADMRHSMGWTAGTTQNFSIAMGSDDAEPTSVTYRRAQNDYCFCLGGSTSSSGPLIRLKSFNSDGASFTYDRNDSGGWNIHYLAIGGTDITDVKAGEFSPTTGTAPYTQDITSVGFQPDVMFFMGARTVPPTSPAVNSVAEMTFFQGAATNAVDEHFMSFQSRHNVTTTDTLRYQRTNACIHYFAPGNNAATGAEANLNARLSNGFRLQWTVSPTYSPLTNTVFYLAIKGGSWTCSKFNTPTSGTIPYTQTISGLDHATKTLKGLYTYGYNAETDVTPFGAVKFSWGAADSSTSRWNIMGGDDDGEVDSEALRGHKTTCVLTSFGIEPPYEEAADVFQRADLNSLGTNQFILDWENNTDNSAREWLFVSVADNTGLALIKKSPLEVINIIEDRTFNKFRLARAPKEVIQNLEAKSWTRTRSRKAPKEIISVIEAKSRIRGILRKAPKEVISVSDLTRRIRGITRFAPEDQIQSLEGVKGILGRLRMAPLDQSSIIESKYFRRGRNRKPSLEVVQNIETKRRKVLFYEAYITPAHLTFYYSGGASNTSNAASTGGARSIFVASSAMGAGGGFIESGFEITGFETSAGSSTGVWDIVLQSEALAGKTEYRCFYLRNNHSGLTAYQVKLWMGSNTEKGTVYIGKGSSAINGTEQGPFLETTAPDSVTFTLAPDEASAIDLGNIPSGQHQAIWFKREIPASTTAFIGTKYSLQISYYSDFT